MGFFDTLFGTSASETSNAAAGDTYKKQRKAINKYNQSGNEYAHGMRDLSRLFSPYAKAGQKGLAQLMSGLGLGGAQGSAEFTEAYRALPGYQSGLETGTNAAIAGQNAGGMLQSGRAMKELQRYGSDYEDQRVDDYLARLAGLSTMGQQATGSQVATAGQGLGGQLQQRGTAFTGDMNAAGTVGQGMVAGAQAEQSALTNLMGMGSYLAGSFLGGPAGASTRKSFFG